MWKSLAVKGLQAGIILSPWFLYGPLEKFSKDEEVHPRTVEFVQSEIKKHEDLEGQQISIR